MEADTNKPETIDTDGWARAPHASEFPPRLRLLCIAPKEPTWVNLTLGLDAEGCHEPQFRWISTGNEALTLLRDESFDCILLEGAAGNAEASANPLGLLHAIRASGCDDPCVYVAASVDDDDWSRLVEADCEPLATSKLWDSPALIPVIKRAVRRVELHRDNHRLSVANHRRLVRERDEAEHLLGQQRQILKDLEAIVGALDETDAATSDGSAQEHGGAGARFSLPEGINDYYDELLRTYVIMGSGSLSGEIAKLAELLAVAGLSPRETLQLHLERVETLVRGLGNRSTRHVMARSDLLALELMIHLGECYQQRITLADEASST